MPRRSTSLALAALALILPAQALAQNFQCRIPSEPIEVPKVGRDGERRITPIGGYTLALSWSPEFCKGRQSDGRHARQCSGWVGRFGFIVHGLWPEGEGSEWPQYCRDVRLPSAETIRPNMCMTPDAGLLVHEWAKHGSCMTRTAESYYKVTRILWNSLRFPDYDALSRREGLTAGDVRRAFADANEYWEPDMVGLVVNERGWLEEMRLCYDEGFYPTRCDARRLGPDDGREVQIWRGL